MHPAIDKNKSKVMTRITALLLVSIAIMGLQACGGGGGGNDPVVTPKDADPKGYFTGTALLNGGAVDVQDMVGMAYDKRLMVFSMVENLLFDITITDITIDDFSGTVDVYVNGVITGSGVTISGTTSNTRIQGTFAGGSGLSTGNFDILFDTNNNLGATLDRYKGDNFLGALSGIDVDASGFNDAPITASTVYNIGDLTTDRCEVKGNLVLPSPDVNIYQLSHDVILQPGSGGTCATPYLSTNHTGFASIIATTNADDTFVFAYANGNVALFSSGLTR